MKGFWNYFLLLKLAFKHLKTLGVYFAFFNLLRFSALSLFSIRFIVLAYLSPMDERLMQLETQSFVKGKLIRIIITGTKEFLLQIYARIYIYSGKALLYFTLGNLVNCSRSSVKMKQSSHWVILTNLFFRMLMKILYLNNLDLSLISACNFLCFASTDCCWSHQGLTQSLFMCAIANRWIKKVSLLISLSRV